MNNIQKKFIYLYQIINTPVTDSATGKRLGVTTEIVAELREMYPKVCALIMRDARTGRKLYVPWKHVKMVIEEKDIFIENGTEFPEASTKTVDTEIPLKETFWDKQIVDINGSKVVRVNDLHLLKEGLNLWVVHVDVGVSGLIRRLGCLPFVYGIVKLISSYELKEHLISWKFVQPIASSIGTDALALKVHHSRLSELHPADLADILADLGTEERITILKSLDNITAASTFQELPLKIRLQVAEAIDQKHLLDILNEMDMDEVVDLLSQLPKKKTNSLCSKLPPEKVSQISNLICHAEHIAGSIMNTQFIFVRHTLTAGMVLEKIRTEYRKKESIYYIYVVDDADTLVGVVTLQQLLTVPAEKIVSEFMRKRVAKVKVDTNVKNVAGVFYKYDFTVVPVVDKFNKIQGIITMKDAFESVFREIGSTQETG